MLIRKSSFNFYFFLCLSGQILLPKEEGDDELDCPFPTLEEAEEIANEMKESAHLRKNQMNRDKVKIIICLSTINLVTFITIVI